MRALLACSFFGAFAVFGLRAQDPAAAPVFVEVEPSATTAWVHQPIECVVRVGYDAAFFAASALPLFQQRLDQPFQVVVPWLLGADDRAVEIVAPAAGIAGQRIATGDRVAVWLPVGQRHVGERVFELLELRCRWLPLAAGPSKIAPVELRYAFAERFEDDFLRGRQPLDRQETSVLSATLVLTVHALPTSGRPAGFTGAVGEFSVRAAASVPTVVVGATFSLEVAVEGDGNFGRFAPMAWPQLAGLHVQGLVEQRAASSRTYVFDVLALRAGLLEVPAVPFVSFSPRAGAYVTSQAGPVPLRVVPLPAGATLPERVQSLVAADARAVRAADALPWWYYALAGVAFAAIVMLWRARQRRAAQQAEVQATIDDLAVALGRDPGEALAAFEAMTARCAGVESRVAEAMFEALVARGLPTALLARVRDVHAGLDAVRFGGVPPAVDDVLAAARQLAAHSGRS